MIKLGILTALTGLMLSGCATGPYEWKYGQDKIVPGQFGMTNTDTTGTVLTWPSHAVAAIVYPNGDAACIQSAQSAKARSSAGNGSITGTLAAGEKIGAAVGQAINEAVASIQDRNDVATFLDVALFQICTISRNKQMDSRETIQLIERALLASENIAKARPQITRGPNTLIVPAGAKVVELAEPKSEEQEKVPATPAKITTS